MRVLLFIVIALFGFVEALVIPSVNQPDRNLIFGNPGGFSNDYWIGDNGPLGDFGGKTFTCCMLFHDVCCGKSELKIEMDFAFALAPRVIK